MVTGHLVTTHGTQFLDALFSVGQLGTSGRRVNSGCGRGHGRTAAVSADGHILLEAIHGAGHSASSSSATVSTCGTEQICCVHITELITALVTATHHRVRGGRAG